MTGSACPDCKGVTLHTPDCPRPATRAPRPWTLDTVDPDTGTHTMRMKRACNGCGRGLGDATHTELAAAMDGAPLPDVREECGCVTWCDPCRTWRPTGEPPHTDKPGHAAHCSCDECF